MAAQVECMHLQAYKYLHHLFYDVSFLIQKDNMERKKWGSTAALWPGFPLEMSAARELWIIHVMHGHWAVMGTF